MSPIQLAAKHTESGEQKALLAWSAMATLHGFEIANDMHSYTARTYLVWRTTGAPVPALRWLHCIPNGGARDPITAARMKAEGVKRGVPDLFLPVARHGWHGLYLEMKKDKGKPSDEQKEFAVHCETEQYAFHFCYNWREAANFIEQYLR